MLFQVDYPCVSMHAFHLILARPQCTHTHILSGLWGEGMERGLSGAGEWAFINKIKQKKTTPWGKNRLATRLGKARQDNTRLDRTRQGRAGYIQGDTMTNWHRTANTRRINKEQMRRVTRETQVGQINQ